MAKPRKKRRLKKINFPVEEYLRSTIDVYRVGRTQTGLEEIICTCVFDCQRPKKLYVSKLTGRWLCYKCTPKGGVFAELVAHIEQIPLSRARKKILDHKLNRIAQSISDLSGSQSRVPVKHGLKDEGLPPEYVPVTKDHVVPYLRYERGFTIKTCMAFRLGEFVGGAYDGYAAMPIIEDGEVVSWTARAMRGQLNKYMNPGAAKTKWVYGIDLLRGHRVAVLVEGPTDVISMYQKRFHERGYPAVAPLGSDVSPRQMWKIKRRGIRKLIVLFDSDDKNAAAKAIDTAILASEYFDEVSIASLPPGLDPDKADVKTLQVSLDGARDVTLRDRLLH